MTNVAGSSFITSTKHEQRRGQRRCATAAARARGASVAAGVDAEAARRVVHARRDLREARLDRLAARRRRSARGRRRPARRCCRSAAGRALAPVIAPQPLARAHCRARQRNQHADRDHRAGHGVAQRRDAARGARRASGRVERARVGDEQREPRRRAAARQRRRRESCCTSSSKKRGPNCASPASSASASRISAGSTKPRASGTMHASDRQRGARQPRSAVALRGACRRALSCEARARRVERARARAAATTKPSSTVGELRRRGAVAEREPRAKDAGGERLHAEVRDGAEIGERLHERERGAGDDRRARERQRDAPERCRGGRGRACARLRASAGGRSRKAVRASR